MQLQAPLLHIALDPQGEGLQGSSGWPEVAKEELHMKKTNNYFSMRNLRRGGGVGASLQLLNGSPVYPVGQTQVGV